ncbi:hypothetical protein [Methylocaldum sp.]|jgi:hypothetical protein|uniref:hypothetical protein n=1 Tax=Methylocaldum sp. TaxID=1969727 RepID=UPI003220049A
MKSSEQMSFHEATVTHFCSYCDTVELNLDGVDVGGEKRSVAIRISEVFRLEIDGKALESAFMPAEDGEILILEILENGIFVIIEWNDFSNKKSFTNAYRISGEGISVSII